MPRLHGVHMNDPQCRARLDAADLPKMVIMYWDFEEQEAARHFVQMYLQGSAIKEGFVDRFRVHMLHQRILDWGCAKAIGAVTWDPQLAFSEWAKDYVYAMDYLRSWIA